MRKLKHKEAREAVYRGAVIITSTGSVPEPQHFGPAAFKDMLKIDIWLENAKECYFNSYSDRNNYWVCKMEISKLFLKSISKNKIK